MVRCACYVASMNLSIKRLNHPFGLTLRTYVLVHMHTMPEHKFERMHLIVDCDLVCLYLCKFSGLPQPFSKNRVISIRR